MKIVKIKDYEIQFDNGSILTDYHRPDCCEMVYADFSMLKHYNVSTVTGDYIDIYKLDFEEDIKNLIKIIKGMRI